LLKVLAEAKAPVKTLAFMESTGAEGETPTPSAYFFKKIISGFM
jgi:hypothetical protein